MTDDEYKAHFSMWAALKSPLLMGNDLRRLSARSLTILNNPAVIAINQDPEGRSATRIWRNADVQKDKYGMGETQIWSGHLSGGDEVLVFLNAADEDAKMTASLQQIFYSDGPEGSAKQVHMKWDVYDLWANRMDDETAQNILDANDNTDIFQKTLQEIDWYNSTTLSYSDGLKVNDQRLLGRLIRTIQPRGTLEVSVKRHSVEMYRLRSPDNQAKDYMPLREEL